MPPDRPAAAERPTVVALPGAGSTAELLRRFFGPALRDVGLRLVAADHPVERSGPGPLDESQYLIQLDELVDRYQPVLLAGVSLGAHLVARWTAQRLAGAQADRVRPLGLLLAAPAWTGEPGHVASLSAWSAARLRERGLPAVLAETRAALADGSVGKAAWVAEELLRAWPGYEAEALARQLDLVAVSAAPTDDELASLALPVGVLAWRDDPWHPEQVARHWASRLPQARLDLVDLSAVGDDRAVLGRRLLAAVRSAGWDSGA